MLGKITTVSYSQIAKQDTYSQLNDLIGQQVEITSYAYSELPTQGGYSTDLVVVTTPWILDQVLPLLAPGCPYICAKRNIDLKNIHRILDIPKGSDVLVLNNLHENALEVIGELNALGITGFNYFPQRLDRPLERSFDYAITIGESDAIVEKIPHVYDLGMRQINLLTVAEILHFFTGKIVVDELLTSRHIKTSVQTILELNTEIRKNEALRSRLSMLVESFDDGILIVEDQNRVGFCNATARRLLKLPPDGGKLPDWLITAIRDNGDDAFFLHQDDMELQIEVRGVLTGPSPARMVLVKDIELIRRIDIRYRTHEKINTNYTHHTFEDILYIDNRMQQVVEGARQMANSLSNVLITGESGVGKEIVAQAMHNASPCSDGPFVAINCGAISDSLLESELFGYDEGAFTGASKKGKIGLVELAHNGTLFLDEIGDASLSIQQKLLRVIQEKTIFRVAGREPIYINVRIIAATNQDLLALSAEKKFRSDLYYRLNVLPTHIPALRERKADIPLLFHFFLKRQMLQHGQPMVNVDSAVFDLLQGYNWPGNVRELENLCEYLVNYIIHVKTPNLHGKIQEYLLRQQGPVSRAPASSAPPIDADSKVSRDGITVLRALDELSREGRLIGQRQIQDMCRQYDREYTLYRLKKILANLKAAGLVEAAVGKGTQLTERGRGFLSKG